METSNMKNIVVLKNLPSNLVDEAIVILKANKNARQFEYADNSSTLRYNESVDKKDYIIKEAESVISNYISKIENGKNKISKNITVERKYKTLKIYTIIISSLLFFIFIKDLFA